MKWVKLAAAAAALGVTAVPAVAQGGLGYDGETFVKAIRDKDGAKAMELLEKRRAGVLNARDGRGETGLIVALARRDDSWAGFLLKEGADPNYPAQNGDTPLIVAARAGHEQGVEWLLGMRAKVDADNRMGETPLIVAVQQRHSEVVKMLLKAGANPDKTDNAAGYSARDYARRDTRARDILALIEGAGTKQAPKSDKLDDFKL